TRNNFSEMNHLREHVKPYAKAIVKLLRGTVDKDDKVWSDILHYRDDIQAYINQIGLELILQEDDGYALVRQFEIDEDGRTIGLVSRRQVGFEISVILVLLRQIMEEFEVNAVAVQTNEKIIYKSELKEEIELFLPEKYNRIRFLKELDTYIRRIVDLGYLKEIAGYPEDPRYRIHKMIKEKITIDTLNDFKEKLRAYVQPV
ncbi:MAG: DUF4194 domain-containing protein, partial [Bacteroidota bacterium]